MLVRIEEIVRRGRIRGFILWLITQRPAVARAPRRGERVAAPQTLAEVELTAIIAALATGRLIRRAVKAPTSGMSERRGWSN